MQNCARHSENNCYVRLVNSDFVCWVFSFKTVTITLFSLRSGIQHLTHQLTLLYGCGNSTHCNNMLRICKESFVNRLSCDFFHFNFVKAYDTTREYGRIEYLHNKPVTFEKIMQVTDNNLKSLTIILNS